MLDSWTIVVFDVFFDLGLALFGSFGGFVDGHFDEFVGGCHDDGFEG